jgi:serine/threonine-protein kinase
LLLVMEFVDGASLDHVLRTGALPVTTVVHVVEVLRGLDDEHGAMRDGIRGIVHRDMSPHNTMLLRDGGVKIADFGIAKARNCVQPHEELLSKARSRPRCPATTSSWLDKRK